MSWCSRTATLDSESSIRRGMHIEGTNGTDSSAPLSRRAGALESKEDLEAGIRRDEPCPLADTSNGTTACRAAMSVWGAGYCTTPRIDFFYSVPTRHGGMRYEEEISTKIFNPDELSRCHFPPPLHEPGQGPDSVRRVPRLRFHTSIWLNCTG